MLVLASTQQHLEEVLEEVVHVACHARLAHVRAADRVGEARARRLVDVAEVWQAGRLGDRVRASRPGRSLR